MVKIGIIDTGVNLLHPKLADKNIICKVINDNNAFVLTGNSDNVGHGTAICGIISENDYVDITVIKAFDSTDTITEDMLISALEYVLNCEHFDILNLSFGISTVSDLNRLEKICKDITDKGTLIVSSFNNYGSISYPAAFSFVLGVDWDIECKRNSDYIFCDSKVVDVYGKGMNQKLCWSPQSDYIVNSGASFASAHICSVLIPWIQRGEVMDCNQARIMIAKTALKKVRTKCNYSSNEIPCLKGKRISVFPYNKEIISVTNYSDMLECDLVHVYDVNVKGNINNSTLSFSHRAKYSNAYKIQKFEDIIEDRDSFDTLVVGHLAELNQITKHNYTKDCIDFCLIYGKNMISFDTITEIIRQQFQKKNLKCYSMNIEQISCDSSGKLRMIGVPIVSVIGTSSKQGKFSLQLELRKKFIDQQYAVGQWATEPQGYLFGIDKVFPTGYGSNLNFFEKEVLQYVNRQLYDIERMGKDVIITGLQSYVLSDKLYNSRMYPFMQNALLSAIQPDTMVLVTNVCDSNDYILRSLNYIESLTGAKTACIVLSPRNMQPTFSPLEEKEALCSEEDMAYRISEISSLAKRKVLRIDQIDEIFDSIINELS